MKTILLKGPSIDCLQLSDTDLPQAGHGEVLIRQRAVSLNYLDLAIATGRFSPVRFPLVPGADSAGEIVALGDGVDGWAVGDRVIVGTLLRWQAGRLFPAAHDMLRGVTVDGGLAEYAAVPAAALVHVPSHLDWHEAATLPIAATTAWNAIVKGGVRPGSIVVLLGTGSVTLYALQLAKAAGARVIVTSSSHEKLARVRHLGADNVIHYGDTPAWDEEVLRLTSGHGADLVLESVGAATFARSLNAAAYGGTVFVIGFVGGTELAIPVLPIMLKTLTILGNNTGSTADVRDAAHAVAAVGIRPVIERSFSLRQTQDAYRYLADAGHVGKIVIDVEAE